ncbi:hypothetical protein BTUL_0005g00050 [Botrytis tulipae]|uniref:Uncharacterized protein n=1 Tax=Botrytis tulipae TaxID=87230 RepID=A0A4Z1F6X8_9HELO|nr:hypothetical protein BTUL_0005g00050 [Botrytis tulipae]
MSVQLRSKTVTLLSANPDQLQCEIQFPNLVFRTVFEKNAIACAESFPYAMFGNANSFMRSSRALTGTARATQLLEARSILYDLEPTCNCDQNLCWIWEYWC